MLVDEFHVCCGYDWEHIHTYAVDVTIAEERYVIDGSKTTLNKAGLVNDYRTNDISGDPELDRSNDIKRINSQFIWALVEGKPVLAIVATRYIGKGEEVLLDYGGNYWRGKAARENGTLVHTFSHWTRSGDSSHQTLPLHFMTI